MNPAEVMVADAEAGTPQTISRDGVPVAVVVGYDDYRNMVNAVNGKCPNCDHPKAWHHGHVCGVDCPCQRTWDA